MTYQLEITDRGGMRTQGVEAEVFSLGARRSGCDVEVDVAMPCGRVLEVRTGPAGQIQIRAEAGLPFPVRCMAGNVGTRFENLLEGDTLNVGPALVRIRHQASDAGAAVVRELDPATLQQDDAPGSPVGGWYQTFMGFADHLEGLTAPERMIETAMSAIVDATGADRVHVEVDLDVEGVARQHWLTRGGERAPFRPSRSLVELVRESSRVVHVPIVGADPVASRYQSVRREGISSGIALPLQGLGKTLGVLYADCVREGAMLSASDLQRIVFICRLLASALGNRDLVANLVRSPGVGESGGHFALQTRSPACTSMVEHVLLYAPTDYTVLIRGETGTGKEVIARAIHELSQRRAGPFVPVNCAAIPESLMESMLFGHEKGAFTGATQARAGHFEEAQGGTIFLDEIGDMALELQAKILRVLQDRMVTPVGARRSLKVDVRVLAATHQDLEKMVAEGVFREDLYYRLRELEIVLPPLRRRPEDVLMLANRFLGEAARELGYPRVPELAAEALAFLQRQTWRGNIRELRHVVKGAALRAGGNNVQVQHLELAPALARGGPVGEVASGNMTWRDRLEMQERAALKETFDRAGGNLTRGAELFGVPRTTYREKLLKAGLLRAKDDDPGEARAE
ncbi:MAG: sigma-54-dependent Fis family transcriptional regulator [Planctomycetes bacterium]|nr:sigma-54-dependent Fis family transcriptional regulator [Planctomycetota bacterium]